MKAIWNDTVIAEAPKEELVYIEGNWYFPRQSLHQEFYKPSDTHTTCHWKGEASYFNVEFDGQNSQDAAWYYPNPKSSAIDQVKKDFTDYVAFWRGVKVEE